MKLARFLLDGLAQNGVVQGEKANINGTDFNLESLNFLPPCEPKKIVCVGLNYMDHAIELGMKPPKEPVIFLKPTSALIPHKGDIILPGQSKKVDFEGELALVIKKRCRYVKKEDARDFVLGLTCFNDVTARDIQERDVQWTRAKGFDTFAPVGPWIVTGDEFNSLEDLSLRIKTKKSGVVKQDSNTDNLIFNIPYLVEFISGVMTLEPGDIISTGTPPGVGNLTQGDKIEVFIEGVGSLVNQVKSRGLSP